MKDYDRKSLGALLPSWQTMTNWTVREQGSPIFFRQQWDLSWLNTFLVVGNDAGGIYSSGQPLFFVYGFVSQKVQGKPWGSRDLWGSRRELGCIP